jgi:hypothetical protein
MTEVDRLAGHIPQSGQRIPKNARVPSNVINARHPINSGTTNHSFLSLVPEESLRLTPQIRI